MNGKLIVSGIVGVALIAGAGLWYSIQYGYYREVTDVTAITIAGDAWPVSDYRGIDADSSPLKMRACFTVDWDYVPVDTWEAEAAPLRAPFWFDCFDARQIGEDLAADRASVVAALENVPFGFTGYVVQYPDGRAFMWRQINACGEASFNGEDLPEGCVETASLDLPETNAGGVPDLAMTLIPVGGGGAEEIVTEDLQVVSDNADPASLWACFRVINSLAMLTESFEVAETAAPVAPVSDFPCFDADTLTADLAAGTALPFVGARGVSPGIDRMVAIYDDGRAFAWHQRNN